jgi:hypothetical protein
LVIISERLGVQAISCIKWPLTTVPGNKQPQFLLSGVKIFFVFFTTGRSNALLIVHFLVLKFCSSWVKLSFHYYFFLQRMLSTPHGKYKAQVQKVQNDVKAKYNFLNN